MNTVAAVGAAALCAGVSVGLFTLDRHNAAANVAAAKSAPLSAPLTAAMTMPAEAAASPEDASCTQGWPYYPAGCLRGSAQTATVRVIALDRGEQAGKAQARSVHAAQVQSTQGQPTKGHAAKAPARQVRTAQNRVVQNANLPLRTARAQ